MSVKRRASFMHEKVGLRITKEQKICSRRSSGRLLFCPESVLCGSGTSGTEFCVRKNCIGKKQEAVYNKLKFRAFLSQSERRNAK